MPYGIGGTDTESRRALHLSLSSACSQPASAPSLRRRFLQKFPARRRLPAIREDRDVRRGYQAAALRARLRAAR